MVYYMVYKPIIPCEVREVVGEFQSNIKTAEQVATLMGQADLSLQKVIGKSLNPAIRTTLSGNDRAQQVNQKLIQVVQQFQVSFKKDAENIRSVAHEFAANDAELKKNFETQNLFENPLADILDVK